MGSLRLAISFLTIIPAYGNRIADDREMANSLTFYPLVGLLVGAFLALLAYLFHWLALGISGDALLIVAWIIITGGLHLDGLMDTADGLFSGKDRDRKLEIMRDSRVGAMGVMALAALLILKLSFLNGIPYPEKIWVLVLAPALGRCMLLYACCLYPYARSGPGLGKTFAEQASKLHIIIATIILLAACLYLHGIYGLVFVLIAAFIVLGVMAWIGRILGGLTGDTYGAVCELAETVFIMTVVFGMALGK